MFEHLSPAPESSFDIKKRETNFKVYLSLLSVALIVFLISLSISQGPSSGAFGSQTARFHSRISSQAVSRQVVVGLGNLTLFTFNLDIESEYTSLYQLKVLINGIYDPEIISNIKLFHNDVQLGEVKEIDNQGNIYFKLKDYILPKGNNQFTFVLAQDSGIQAGQVLDLSIESPDDIFLSQNGHLFRPDGSFPIIGGLVSFVESDTLVAYNNYKNSEFLLRSGLPEQIAGFSLGANSEIVHLSGLTLSYDELRDTDNLSSGRFVLSSENHPLAQADIDPASKHIVFDFDNYLILKNNHPLSFDVHTLSLPEGNYIFSLESVVAQGAQSGQAVSLLEPIVLSRPVFEDYFLQFDREEIYERLSEGWNTLYSLRVKSQGTTELDLNKLSWSIDKEGVDILTAAVWLDNQPYIGDVIVEDKEIIFKADAQNPLLVTESGTTLDLLVKVKLSSDQASLAASLSTDQAPIADDNDSYILWSAGKNYFNGYLLPNLPLAPSVLSTAVD